MAEGGEKVLWPSGYDPSDNGAAASASHAADAAVDHGTHRELAACVVVAAPSDVDLVALRDLADLEDLGAKVVWPPGLDRRSALRLITAGTAARVSSTDAPT